jgi:prefoldin subunit 2
VIETLDPLDDERKCFRLVNGVLVERTVKEVLPTLKTNSDGLKQVLEEMLKQYKAKQAELDTWKVSAFPVAKAYIPQPGQGTRVFS